MRLDQPSLQIADCEGQKVAVGIGDRLAVLFLSFATADTKQLFLGCVNMATIVATATEASGDKRKGRE